VGSIPPTDENEVPQLTTPLMELPGMVSGEPVKVLVREPAEADPLWVYDGLLPVVTSGLSSSTMARPGSCFSIWISSRVPCASTIPSLSIAPIPEK